MRKPKRKDNRKHRIKNFNYLIKKPKKNKKAKANNGGKKTMKVHTVHDANGKSVIRNINEVFKPLIFADFNYLLEGKQSLTDLDGQLEINGNIFLIESKTHYSSINGGQLVSLFHTAYNTWKNNKIGQLTYRVETNKKDAQGQQLFDYVIFGSNQFQQYEKGEEVVPYYELGKPNSWLANRLRAFQEACYFTHDRTVQLNNRNLFGAVDKIKRHLQKGA